MRPEVLFLDHCREWSSVLWVLATKGLLVYAACVNIRNTPILPCCIRRKSESISATLSLLPTFSWLHFPQWQHIHFPQGRKLEICLPRELFGGYWLGTFRPLSSLSSDLYAIVVAISGPPPSMGDRRELEASVFLFLLWGSSTWALAEFLHNMEQEANSRPAWNRQVSDSQESVTWERSWLACGGKGLCVL